MRLNEINEIEWYILFTTSLVWSSHQTVIFFEQASIVFFIDQDEIESNKIDKEQYFLKLRSFHLNKTG